MFLFLRCATSSDLLKKELEDSLDSLNRIGGENDQAALTKLVSKENNALQFGNVRFAAFANSVGQLKEKLQSALSNNTFATTTRFTKESQVMFAMSCIGTELNALKKKDDKTGLRARVDVLESAFNEVADRLRTEASFDFFSALEVSTNTWNRQPVSVICPLLFGFHYGIVALWKAFGVRPNQISSYSMGEASGAFQCGMVPNLNDAIRLAKIQGECHDLALGIGTMMVVIGMPTSDLQEAVKDIGCEIGALIAADLNCLTGTQSQLDDAHSLLSSKKNKYEKLTLIKNGVCVPFHSRHYYQFENGIRAQYRDTLKSFEPSATHTLKWSSSIVGHEATRQQSRSDEFWFDLFVKPAYSANIMKNVSSDVDVFLEINTRPLYCRSFVEYCESIHRTTPILSMPTTNHVNTTPPLLDEVEQFLQCICELYVNGVDSCDFQTSIEQTLRIK